jgi:hypothetical protein
LGAFLCIDHNFQSFITPTSFPGGTNDGTCANGYGICCVCKLLSKILLSKIVEASNNMYVVLVESILANRILFRVLILHSFSGLLFPHSFFPHSFFHICHMILFWGVSDPFCAYLLLRCPPFFPLIRFVPNTLLTGMTGISLHMQWPLTSQSHGSFSQREQLVFCYSSNSTPLSN